MSITIMEMMTTMPVTTQFIIRRGKAILVDQICAGANSYSVEKVEP